MKAAILILDKSAAFEVTWDCDEGMCKAHESHAVDALLQKLTELRLAIIHDRYHPKKMEVHVGCGIEIELVEFLEGDDEAE